MSTKKLYYRTFFTFSYLEHRWFDAKGGVANSSKRYSDFEVAKLSRPSYSNDTATPRMHGNTFRNDYKYKKRSKKRGISNTK